MMRVKIKSLECFHAGVFGAECLLLVFPEIQTTGVLVEKTKRDGKVQYQMIDERGRSLGLDFFFSAQEMKYLEKM